MSTRDRKPASGPEGQPARASQEFTPPALRSSTGSSTASTDPAPAETAPVAPAEPAAASAAAPNAAAAVEDCGVCANCLDKPKFGGPGIKRKGCMSKREQRRQSGAGHPPAAEAASQPAEADAELMPAPPPPSAASAPARAPAAEPPAAEPSRRRIDAASMVHSLGKTRTACAAARRAAAADAKADGDAASGSDSDADEGDAMDVDEGAAKGEAGPSDADGSLASVRLIGRGLHVSPRAPLHELSVNRRGKPSTPLSSLMKTPEIESLLAAAMQSPLSDFANILNLTPRVTDVRAAPPPPGALRLLWEGRGVGGGTLHSRSRAQGATPEMSQSPLWQLASLMEKTPRLPTESKLGMSRDPPSDPEELKQALLLSSLQSTSPSATPDELRRDLDRALRQASTLASPNLCALLASGSGLGLVARSQSSSSQMPPPEPPEEGRSRKRKLEATLEGDPAAAADGMFDDLDEIDFEHDERIAELFDGTALIAQMGDNRRRSSLGGAPRQRTKPKEKEKGKPTKCRCDRSGCLKRYCVCFGAGLVCSAECKCKGCKNDEASDEHREERAKAMLEMQKKKANAFTPRVGGDGEKARARARTPATHPAPLPSDRPRRARSSTSSGATARSRAA